MTIRSGLFINGQWKDCAARATANVDHSGTGDVIATVALATPDDVNTAVASARAAFEGWAALSPKARADYLVRIAQGLRARSAEIARTISMEVGMPLKLSARIQVDMPIAAWETYARMIQAFPLEEAVGNSMVVREPVGVVACITPWNYPLNQVTNKVAAALAAGCTVVLKPSEVAPLSALALAEAAQDAGLPPGVFNVVVGYGPDVGEALVRHPEVDMVSFTGSTRAGKQVARVAAETVKRVALELGGKSASVILDDADLPAAVRGTVASCFLNSGQTCSALTRMLVPESRYDEAKALAQEAVAGFKVGDPLQPDTRLGPLVSAAQRQRVLDYIRTGIAEGAELVAGGPQAPAGCERGHFVQPTVFGRVAPRSRLGQEEVFGPVLAIQTYQTEDEAVAIANGTAYGLGGAVWSAEEARALRVARRLRTGQVDINGAPFNPQAPFGGFKQSGLGRENGRFGLEEFFEIKSLQRRV